MTDDTNTRPRHPVVARFCNNARGFWAAHRWLLIVFVISLLCDAASTIYFMLQLGPGPEIHPVIRVAATIAGPVLGPLLGAFAKTIAGVMVSIYCRRFAVYILVLTAIISFWAAWYNVWGVEMYRPIFMKYLP
ncbi:MAG: hypothetical protein HN350_17080 [Phycisphaerales bacterium]|nr:hypothetical protein [Phycisphaerales bacterium]